MVRSFLRIILGKYTLPALIGLCAFPALSLAQVDPASAPGWWQSHLDDAIEKSRDLYNDGRLSMYLSGYAHHGRSTYSPDRIAELNEKTWGLGMSKEMRDAQDNEESLLFVVMADSHYSPQITGGYQYEWMTSVGKHYEAGMGYMAGLVSRPDIFNGLPFPGALPVASFGTRDTKLVFTYLPRLSKNKGNGDVLFFSLRTNLK